MDSKQVELTLIWLFRKYHMGRSHGIAHQAHTRLNHASFRNLHSKCPQHTHSVGKLAHDLKQAHLL